MSAMNNDFAGNALHSSIQSMMERFGVTAECREFLAQRQKLYVNGQFTDGPGQERRKPLARS